VASNGLVIAAAGPPVFYSGQVVPIRAVDVMSAARAGLTSGSDALAASGTYVGDSQVVAATDYPLSTVSSEDNPRGDGIPGAGTFADYQADKVALADPTLEFDLTDYIDPSWPFWNDLGEQFFVLVSVRLVGDPDPLYRQYENFELADYCANMLLAESSEDPGVLQEFTSQPSLDTGRFPALPSVLVPNYQLVRTGFSFSSGMPTITIWALTLGPASTVEIRIDQLIIAPAAGVALGGGYQVNSAVGGDEPIVTEYDTRGDPRLSILSFGLGTDFMSESQTSSQQEGQGFGSLERQKEDDAPSPPEVTQQLVTLTDYPAPRSIAIRSGVYYREEAVVATDDFARTVTTGWSTRPLPSDSLAWFTGVSSGTMSRSVNGSEGCMDSSSTVLGRVASGLFGTTWFVDVDNTAGETGAGFAPTRSLEGQKDIDTEISVRATTSPGSGQAIAAFGLGSWHNSLQPQLTVYAYLVWNGSDIDLYLRSFASIQPLNNWPAGNNMVEEVGPIGLGLGVTDTVRVRVRSTGLKIDAKAWEDGDTEPDWQLELWLPGGWNDGVNPSNWWLYPYADEPDAVQYTHPDFWRLTWLPAVRMDSGTAAFGTRWTDFVVSFPGDGVDPTDISLELRSGASVLIPELAIPYGAEYLYAHGPVIAGDVDRYEWSPSGSSLWQAIKSTVIHFVPEPGARTQIWRYR
jgi:hypothetical protein